MASPLSAASAYASMAKLSPDAALRALRPQAGKEEGASFGAALKDALMSVKEMGQKSDAQTKAVITGKANIVDAVTAVAETEVAIDAVVAVRDKVIAAYEEIMRMPI
ncbi:MAG: flagellar hook-basal body complex protein FliE [Xanthobacteraceae bacterium]|uniref:flagellar hook-basal body complex protein FliE n=1 Tax=Pseudolabrys sp. TaxID=1960880 RepID=UPI003D14F806